MSQPALAAWKLPLIVAAIIVSIVGGFYLGGPGLGMAVGALAAAAILVMAIRKPPLHPIRPPLAGEGRRHILVVLTVALELGGAIEAVRATASPAEGDRDEPAEVLLLAPSAHSFLARWTSDSGPGRERAQRRLVLSAASLAKAGVAASARVGDEDLRQGTEDELRSFPATEVIFVTGDGEGRAREAAIADLQSRLLVPTLRLRADQGEDEVRTAFPATRTSHDTGRAFSRPFVRQRERRGTRHTKAGRSRRRAASRG